MPSPAQLSRGGVVVVERGRSDLKFLDDGFELDSVNAVLGASTLQEVGSCFVLDSENTLSNHVWTQERVEILERFYEEHPSEADATVELTLATHQQRYHHKAVLEEPTVSFVRRSTRALMTAHYPGVVVWHDHQHLDRKWGEEDAIVECHFNFTHC